MTNLFMVINASACVSLLQATLAKPTNSGLGKCNSWILPSGDTKSHDNGTSNPFIERAANNWNNIIYHNGKQYLIQRGLMACMLIQKQFS